MICYTGVEKRKLKVVGLYLSTVCSKPTLDFFARNPSKKTRRMHLCSYSHYFLNIATFKQQASLQFCPTETSKILNFHRYKHLSVDGRRIGLTAQLKDESSSGLLSLNSRKLLQKIPALVRKKVSALLTLLRLPNFYWFDTCLFLEIVGALRITENGNEVVVGVLHLSRISKKVYKLCSFLGER